jgi:hypothetical protein
MRIADAYFTGAKSQRFSGMSEVTMVDLWEGVGPSGRFPINNLFPGLDNLPGPQTSNFTARVTGTLEVNAPGPFNFSTSISNSRTRMRLDLNQDGLFDESEAIFPRLQPGSGIPSYLSISNILALTPGNYPFEISNAESGIGLELVYRINGVGTEYLIGDSTGGIGLTSPATVKTVGANVTDPIPSLVITNFAEADALRTGPNEPGFPVSETREVFNVFDSFGAGGPTTPDPQGAPGLGLPNLDGEDNFLVVGKGTLVVPAGGITGAIFRSNTDDGGRLLIDTNQDGDLLDPGDVIILDDRLHAAGYVNSPPVTLAEGNYLIEYSFFELGGGALGAVSVSLTGGPGFTLLGDDDAVAAGFGLEVIPEPSTIALAGLAAMLLMGAAVRRRCC